MSTSPRTDANRAPPAASRSGSGTPTDGSFSAVAWASAAGTRICAPNPQLTLHVKSGAEGDLEMSAPPITDTGERREMLSRIASPNELDAWIEGSPVVDIETPDSVAAVGGRGIARGYRNSTASSVGTQHVSEAADLYESS